MSNNNKKRMSATVSKKFYHKVKQVASRRFLHSKGYMTKFLVLALKILMKLERDPKFVKRINRYVNKNYNHPKYGDRLAQFVEDSIREYLDNHELMVITGANLIIIFLNYC